MTHIISGNFPFGHRSSGLAPQNRRKPLEISISSICPFLWGRLDKNGVGCFPPTPLPLKVGGMWLLGKPSGKTFSMCYKELIFLWVYPPPKPKTQNSKPKAQRSALGARRSALAGAGGPADRAGQPGRGGGQAHASESAGERGGDGE